MTLSADLAHPWWQSSLLRRLSHVNEDSGATAHAQASRDVYELFELLCMAALSCMPFLGVVVVYRMLESEI